MDLWNFNSRWMDAWSAKDVPALLTFYAEGLVYRDPAVAQGVFGRVALQAYLPQLFDATPPTIYTPDELWPTPDGYCARWHSEISLPDGCVGRMRGFDLVVLRAGLIALNEVYVHDLSPAPAIP